MGIKDSIVSVLNLHQWVFKYLSHLDVKEDLNAS